MAQNKKGDPTRSICFFIQCIDIITHKPEVICLWAFWPSM